MTTLDPSASIVPLTDAHAPRSREAGRARTLLMFGSLTWNGVRYSRHHITLGLARRHRVVVVDPPHELRGALRRPWAFLRPANERTEMPGITRHFPPGWLPEVYRMQGLRGSLQRRRVNSLMQALGPEAAGRAINYVWDPGQRAALDGLEHLPLVYHCYDKYDKYTNAPIEQIRRDEQWLARKADVCFAASVKLGEHLEELGARKVVVLRHGVDTRVFVPGLEPPEALKSIPRPRIVIAARMNEVLDLDSLEEIARERPNWSLVLLGTEAYDNAEKRARFQKLCALPHVHYMGHQPAESVPRWLCGMDVALACYDVGTWGAYVQSIKTYEYLACGLPVVSTDYAGSRELAGLIDLCGPGQSFVPAIERALLPSTPEAIALRLAYVRENSWERRVDEVEAELGRIG